MIKKEELDNLLKIKGETRGVGFQTDANYVLEKKGKVGLKKLEKKVKEFGYDIDYRNPKVESWYPIGLRVISLLLVKDTFHWSDKEIREIGKTAPSFSFIIKILMRFLISPKKLMEKSPEMWKKHHRNCGEAEPTEVDEKKKEVSMLLKDLKVHPVFCKYLEGYFEKLMTMVVKSQNVRTRETKCVFRGDPYNEFTTNWR